MAKLREKRVELGKTVLSIISGTEALLTITGLIVRLSINLYFNKKINKLKFILTLRIKSPRMNPVLRKHLIKQYNEILNYASITTIMHYIVEARSWKR